MVAQRRPERPHAIVVKRGRRSCHLSRTPTCLWPGCGAALAADNHLPVCSCHVKPTYRLPHDPRANGLVLHLLVAAYPHAIDLCTVLHSSSHEVRDRIDHLRRQGHRICGARRGYVYELPVVIADRRRARTVKMGA